MKSMTGFGRGTAGNASFQVTVEISAVNSRKQLEMRVSLPVELVSLDAEIRSIVQKRLARGMLNVTVSLKAISGAGQACLSIDFEYAATVCRQLREFAQNNALPSPTLQDVLMVPGVLSKNAQASIDEAKPLLLNALDEALNALETMRTREGDALRTDLLARGERMLSLVSRIEEQEKGAPLAMKERLLERIQALDVEIQADDERLAREVAFLVDKADITEEIVRLKSHLSQYRQFMDETSEVGRNLDFLCQELNREANTLASKCSETAISDLALELKVELSKVREQILNVE